MIVTVHTQGLHTLGQVRAFIAGNAPVAFTLTDHASAHAWMAETLGRFGYTHALRADRGVLRQYLSTVTGLSRAQVTRRSTQFRVGGRIADRRRMPAAPFPRRYTAEDIRLLAEVDAWHGTLSGTTTRTLCERALRVHGEVRFERWAGISNGHLDNWRHKKTYRVVRGAYDKTRPVRNSIGERRKPFPDGRPGYLRVDSVHQGDRDGIKGVYLVHAVDEVTPFQWVCAVEKISERFLVPVLEAMLATFPFTIRGFHSENGSEYINYTVATLLEKLRIEQTKSRSGQTNDNALAESKNASTVRKHLGYSHIPGQFAQVVSACTTDILSPALNFHRPCHFPTEFIDDKGKRRKRYRYEDMMTPYEKLKLVPETAAYLKPSTSFSQLDAIARASSDNEAAKHLNEARTQRFQLMNNSQPYAT